MFGLLGMMGNYDARKVGRYDKDDLHVSTCSVTDAAKDYETAVCHPAYNEGDWVIVEDYDTESEAKAGHGRWVKTMTAKELPKELRDIATAESAQMIDAFSKDKDWKTKPRKD